jgi:shikimate kinase
VRSGEPTRIVLVGFMGAGKSTVGPVLAERLSWSFQEMDHLIEERTGLSIPTLFKTRGESYFREEERKVALSLGRDTRLVVATGGGAFAQPGTRKALQSGATTVWLRASFETLLARAGLGGSRPLAVDRETMFRTWAERDPSYRKADLVVETAGASPEEVARRIVDAVFKGTPTRGTKGP